MKTDLFYWLLNAGIFGSVIGLLVLMLRRFKRLPRRMICALWALPLLRLWMPFGFSSQFSLLTLISRYGTRTVTVYNALLLPDISVTNAVQAADSYFPITYKTNLLESVFSTASLVWLVGFCALVLTGALLYVFTAREMQSARHLRDNVYISDHITGPALFGIIKPRIVIPARMEGENIDYVLRHENTHAKRRDNLFRCIALFDSGTALVQPARLAVPETVSGGHGAGLRRERCRGAEPAAAKGVRARAGGGRRTAQRVCLRIRRRQNTGAH